MSRITPLHIIQFPALKFYLVALLHYNITNSEIRSIHMDLKHLGKIRLRQDRLIGNACLKCLERNLARISPLPLIILFNKLVSGAAITE